MNERDSFIKETGKTPRAATVATFALFILLASLDAAAQFGNPRFSPDEEYLAFDYCPSKCNFIVYSLKNGAAISFAPPQGKTWINPSFGPKGRQVVFVSIGDPADTQIAAIALDGTGYRTLTSSALIKRSPSVSPDGRHILFAGGSKTVTERGSFSSVDLYVTDASTHNERRISDLRVRDISSPFFLPDGVKITFGTVGSAIRRSGLPTVRLDELFPNRAVFVQSMNELFKLEPVLMDSLVASQPMPVSSGEIALLVRVNDIDRLQGSFVYDVFLARRGKAVRHSEFRSYVWSYGISFSGELIAYVTDVPSMDRKSNRLMLWRKKNGKSVELNVPPIIRIRPKNL